MDKIKCILDENIKNWSLFLIISMVILSGISLGCGLILKQYVLVFIAICSFIPAMLHFSWLNKKLIEKYNYFKEGGYNFSQV